MLKEVQHPTVKTIESREDGFAYRMGNGLLIIQSIYKYGDKKLWIHTSFSRKSRMPEYKDMQLVKKIFIGSDREAIMILPKEEMHVNIATFCINFYTPVEHSPLPDFTMGSGSI